MRHNARCRLPHRAAHTVLGEYGVRLLDSTMEARAWRDGLSTSMQVGFVPTMGALHEGHLSLVRESLRQCDVTCVSIFVNPLQFGPSEDFDRYPRTLREDLALLEPLGVAAVLVPAVETYYAPDHSTYLVEERLAAGLCGRYRPGHFRGVATVCLKLFNIIRPHVVYLGQKDAQQCAVLRRMVRDLDLPLRISTCPTVREADGLAMSSRNRMLTPEERARATRIYASLQAVREHYLAGERNCGRLAAIGRGIAEADGAVRLQYWEIVHPTTLEPLEEIGAEGALCAVAGFVGATRLIDNILLNGPANNG